MKGLPYYLHLSPCVRNRTPLVRGIDAVNMRRLRINRQTCGDSRARPRSVPGAQALPLGRPIRAASRCSWWTPTYLSPGIYFVPAGVAIQQVRNKNHRPLRFGFGPEVFFNRLYSIGRNVAISITIPTALPNEDSLPNQNSSWTVTSCFFSTVVLTVSSVQVTSIFSTPGSSALTSTVSP